MNKRSCARAPVRVDPAGGGTDAPPFRIEHGGAVVNMAIGRHAFATAQRLEPAQGVIICSMDLGETLFVNGVGDLETDDRMPFLTAFVRRLVAEEDSILLMTETDVPPGSGLGGSGALGVAITAALDGVYGRHRSALDTAVLANEIERKDLGYPGGDQDSFGAALGGINFFEYQPGGKMTPHKIAVAPDTLRALEHHSLLVYTGAAHVSASIHEDILNSYGQENSPTLRAMFALKEQAQAMKSALEAGNLQGYAHALGESCRQLYNLHGNCDSDVLRRYFTALQDCILAGKTCGAGGGGFIKVLTQPGRRRECIERVKQLGGFTWPFLLDQDGLVTWHERPFDADSVKRMLESQVSK